MRAQDRFGQTLREAPAEAEIPSHRLLLRGAFLRRTASGVYSWLPLGLRVLRRVEQVVREEMDAQGATELLMPALLPMDLLERSGRVPGFYLELYTLKDSADREWYLGPTHEEVICTLASTELPSYKDLPSVPYQIQWKYRYAPRPRGGLLRGREFLMKDAYSFDADEAGLMASYDKMVAAYEAVFSRCGLSTKMIEAQAGLIGGTVNHEFVQPADAGEDTFVSCDGCGYAANTEAAASVPAGSYASGDPEQVVKVHTPGLVTVDEVAAFLKVAPRALAKALLYKSGDGIVCALIPGDRELNEYKLSKAAGGEVRMLADHAFAPAGLVKGFAGPVGLSGVRLIADRSLREATNLVTGANEPDHHLTGVSAGRDFTPDAWEDLLSAQEGDRCERCGGGLSLKRGIEVGHVFQLGTKYSAPMGAEYTDESGARRPFVMGCYGLGVSRTVAAIVEAHNDDRGIMWPRAVAPFEVAVLSIANDAAAAGAAADLAGALEARGVSVLLDDRAGVSAGVKFADADLIGYPLQVVVGRTFRSSGRLEAKVRATGERTEVDATPDEVLRVLGTCP
ncbi:MAG TPA: proline--tRNA ligase [Actinomycetota bacterium]|nr:proline--tRNA ligase [Actinomycetota bacterium]